MSVIVSKYSQSQYYQRFYAANHNVRISSNRSHYSTDELIKADSTALKKAAKQLSSFDYSNNDDGGDIYHAVLAFADTYNNTLSSSGDSDQHDISRLRKSIKSLTSKEKSALSNIGITIKSNGSLSIDEDTLSSARLTNVKKVFSDSNTFTSSLRKYARNLYNTETKVNLSASSQKNSVGTVVDISL